MGQPRFRSQTSFRRKLIGSMINFNGSLISSFNEIQTDFLKKLHTHFSFSEVLRFENGNILFWEYHYFRIIAGLRRHRFEIPMHYTMEYLLAQISSLQGSVFKETDAALIRIQFLPYQEAIGFLISAQPTTSLDQINTAEPYSLDLFKENGIQANNLSNLSTTNATIMTIGKRYAKENGLQDCVLLNDQKNVAETLEGNLYLFQEDKILTPSLESGCQDFALRTAFNEWIDKKQTSIKLVEQSINPFELQKSKELMVLSLEKGRQNVTRYRKTNYTSEQSKVVYQSFLSYLS